MVRRSKTKRENRCPPTGCRGDTQCINTLYGRRCLCPLGKSVPWADFKCPKVLPRDFTADQRAMLLRLDHRKDLLRFKGNCSVFRCGSEAGCYQLRSREDSFVCVCPADHSQPLGDEPSDFLCPDYTNAVANASTRSSTMILSVQNITKSPLSSHAITSAPALFGRGSIVLIAVVSVAMVICLLTAAILTYRLRRPFRKQDKQRHLPAEISKQTPVDTFVMNDNFHSNPNYYHELDEMTRSLNVAILEKESIRVVSEIGQGCFGKVYKGTYKNEDGHCQLVAIKVVKNSSSTDLQNILNEVEIMANCRHPNIIALVGIQLQDNKTVPWMVFEYMEHGDLTELLRKRQKDAAMRFDVMDLHSFALQIARGMAYLAAQHFVHRDLACRNILVGENLVAKISDFGMSRDVYTSDYYQVEKGCRMIPVRWMAPECITYGKFTFEGDIWSYGVLLWEIFSYGKQPYYGHSNEEVVRLVLNSILLLPPDNCPTSVCDVMEMCWRHNPDHRTSFSNIVSKLESIGEQLKYHNYINVNKPAPEDYQFGCAAILAENTDPLRALYTQFYSQSISSCADSSLSFSESSSVAINALDHNNYIVPDGEEPIYLETIP